MPQDFRSSRMWVTYQAVHARAWGLHEGQVYDGVVLPLLDLGSISEDVPKAEECNL